MFLHRNNLRNAPKVVNYERELKKLNDQIAATGDEEKKLKFMKRLSERGLWNCFGACAEKVVIEEELEVTARLSWLLG